LYDDDQIAGPYVPLTPEERAERTVVSHSQKKVDAYNKKKVLVGFI
jgi:hypothetical protein